MHVAPSRGSSSSAQSARQKRSLDFKKDPGDAAKPVYRTSILLTNRLESPRGSQLFRAPALNSWGVGTARTRLEFKRQHFAFCRRRAQRAIQPIVLTNG